MTTVINAIAYQGTPILDDENNNWNFTKGNSWDCTSASVITFVDKVNNKIKGAGKEHTSFQKTAIPIEFPLLLKSYKKSNQDVVNFEYFVHTFINGKLKDNIKSSRFDEGVVIVFVHFTDDNSGDESFLVLMLKNTGALQFTKDLQIKDIDVIDLKQFVQGCKVDVKRFIEKYPLKDNDDIDNHVSFIRGIGDIRDYFKKALLSEDVVTNKKSTENINLAVESFMLKNNLNRDERENVKSSLYAFSMEKKGQIVTPEQIENIIDKHLPLDKNDIKKTFVDFMNTHKYEVNDEFEMKELIIKKLVFLDLDIGFAKINLKTSSLGAINSEKKAIFNSDTRELTITTTINSQKQIDEINKILNG